MQNWTEKIEENTLAFMNEIGGLNEVELNWKPNAQTWSVAENLAHIIAINTSYFPVFQSLRSGDYKVSWLGKIGFMVRFMGKTILKSVSPDRKKKLKTFPIWEPSNDKASLSIIKKFQNHQNKLKEELLKLKGMESSVIASPANKNIVYSVEKAINVMLTHELRHLNQIKEVHTAYLQSENKA